VGTKGLCLAGPPRSGETSRPDSTDPVASGVKCGSYGGKKSRRSRRSEPMQSSSSQPKSAREVCGGSPQNRRVTWLSHKTKTGDSAGGDGIRARRSFDASGRVAGSRGLRREDAVCDDGVVMR
jgi:hypothetical protein